MKYKLIATDIDGTLLNSNHVIPKNNFDAIINAQEKGVIFVLASGRPTFGMLDIAKELKMDIYGGYILSYNGGEILDCKTGKIVYQEKMEEKEIVDIYNYANNNNLSFLTYNDNKIYTNHINEYTKLESKLTEGKLTVIENIDNLDFSKIIKCMLLSNPSNLKEYEKILNKSLFSKKLNFVLSTPVFLEVISNKTSKGNALKELCRILNIKTEECISLGDNYNDIPLLEVTGISVAPSNAVDKVKELVTYVGCSNDDGILKDTIDKYILN